MPKKLQTSSINVFVTGVRIVFEETHFNAAFFFGGGGTMGPIIALPYPKNLIDL